MMLPEDSSRRFHLLAAIGCGLLFAVSVAGCWLTRINVRGVSSTLVGFGVFSAALLPLPVYWHEKRRRDRRDAALAIPWSLLLTVLLPFPFLAMMRLGLPLQDAHFARIDRAMGFSSPAMVALAHRTYIGMMLNRSYNWIPPLLAMAILVPGLLGKRQAKTFLLANIIAALVALPCILLPAMGPWQSEHIPASHQQQICTNEIIDLQHPGPYEFSFELDGAGVICLPSFHVIWAVLSAAAFWGFRWLRVPVALLSTMIIISTMTTGWHYLIDVIAGLAVASGSLWLANRLLYGSMSPAAEAVSVTAMSA